MTPRTRRRRIWFARVTLTIATLAVAAVYVANLPLYAGGGTSTFNWRMEHGRLKLASRSEPGNTESFYIDFNTEGLRWCFDARLWGWRDWIVTVPLWSVLLPCAGATWLAWRAGRTAAVPKKQQAPADCRGPTA